MNISLLWEGWINKIYLINTEKSHANFKINKIKKNITYFLNIINKIINIKYISFFINYFQTKINHINLYTSSIKSFANVS